MRKTGYLKLIVACTFVSLLAACGKDRLSEEERRLQAEGLESLWQTSCQESERFGLSQKQTLDLRGHAILTTIYHWDLECKEPMIEVQELGAYRTGPESGQGRVINFDFSRVNFKVRSWRGVQLFEGQKACEIETWKTGEVVEVTAQTGPDRCWAKTPRTVYDLYRINEEKLFIGKEMPSLNKSMINRRPVEIDLGKPFTKVTETAESAN